MALDIDYLALRFARGVDSHTLPPWLPALTVNGRIVLHRGLTRRQERWYGAHELYHAIYGGIDQRPYIGTNDPMLAIEEAAADAFRDDILMPAAEMLDALEAGLTPDEWRFQFGLPLRVIEARARKVLELWAA